MVSDNLDYTEKDFRISDFSYFFSLCHSERSEEKLLMTSFEKLR